MPTYAYYLAVAKKNLDPKMLTLFVKGTRIGVQGLITRQSPKWKAIAPEWFYTAAAIRKVEHAEA